MFIPIGKYLHSLSLPLDLAPPNVNTFPRSIHLKIKLLHFFIPRNLSCAGDAPISCSVHHQEAPDSPGSFLCGLGSVHICWLWSFCNNEGYHRKRVVLIMRRIVRTDCYCQLSQLYSSPPADDWVFHEFYVTRPACTYSCMLCLISTLPGPNADKNLNFFSNLFFDN